MTEVKLVTDKDIWDLLGIGSTILVPLITLGFGVLVLRLTKRMEQTQWKSQKIIEKRIEEWDGIREELNDIFCYCVRVGDWKSLTPETVIERKRVADKNMHLARPYFSPTFFHAYVRFIKVCFAQYQGHGVDAKIKSPVWEHQDSYTGSWNPDWDILFHERVSTEEELWDAYNELIYNVAVELETNVK